MHSLSLPRAAAALVAGLVFLNANTAPVVCAAVHHSRQATEQFADHAGHHEHGQAPAPETGGATVDGSHTTPPACTDMSHCGLAGSGITTAVSTVGAAAAHPLAALPGTGTRPHAATFSPPTPPPRA